MRAGAPHEPSADAFVAATLASEQGLAALARTLSDRDPAVRVRALEVISEFSRERAERYLIGMLHDPDPNVRCAAAVACARIGGEGTVFSLIYALEDSRAEVRETVAEALERITGREIPSERIADPVERCRVVEDLGEWWKARRMEQLVRENSDDDESEGPSEAKEEP